jgi:hypothetical protein
VNVVHIQFTPIDRTHGENPALCNSRF